MANTLDSSIRDNFAMGRYRPWMGQPNEETITEHKRRLIEPLNSQEPTTTNQDTSKWMWDNGRRYIVKSCYNILNVSGFENKLSNRI